MEAGNYRNNIRMAQAEEQGHLGGELVLKHYGQVLILFWLANELDCYFSLLVNALVNPAVPP